MVGPEEISLAAQRLGAVIRPTPAQFSNPLSKLAGRPVFVKPEQFQRTGSFKIRGAFNRIAALARLKANASILSVKFMRRETS